jgi:hypothetical protein
MFIKRTHSVGALMLTPSARIDVSRPCTCRFVERTQSRCGIGGQYGQPFTAETQMQTSNTDPFRRSGRASALLAALAVGALLLQSCATNSSGAGVGQRLADSGSPSAGKTINFGWTSEDGGVTGTLSAQLDDGASFSGPFMQVTRETHLRHFDPYWAGWRHGWRDWPAWGPAGSGPDLVTHYTGRVIARLQGPGDLRMRCVLHLKAPAKGMGAGGQGQCELSDGRKFDAVFS